MRDGGKVKLYSLQNVAQQGLMPSEKLVLQGEEFCSFVTTGVTRRYAALGADRNYDYVIHLLNCLGIPDGVKYAVLEDGNQYRIDTAELLYDSDETELTLVRLEDYYDVANKTSEPVHTIPESTEG